MNYEQKYKEALAVVQEILNSKFDALRVKTLRKRFEDVFPELKESEDERIRKAIIGYIDHGQHYGVSNADMIAWLEKQSEQKPVDNVEAKFKAGDWIVDDETPNDVFCVIEVLGEIYKVIDIDGDDYHIPHCKADKQFHLCTIQDANDGDVLVFKNNLCGIIICKFPTDYDTRSYCRLVSDSFINEEESGWDSTLLVPATKEQRDLLFEKMKEASYEWDADKKELKKIESKKLDADKVIVWLVANICDFEYYVKRFKQDFCI